MLFTILHIIVGKNPLGNLTGFIVTFRKQFHNISISSRRGVFCKNDALKDVTKFTGKCLFRPQADIAGLSPLLRTPF